MRRNLLIFGTGGFAEEVYSWVDKNQYHVKAFIDEHKSGSFFDIPVIQEPPTSGYADYIIAVGDPKTRVRLANLMQIKGFNPCEAMIHPSAIVGINSHIHRGSILCQSVIVTTSVTVGMHGILNLHTTVGHNSVLGHCVTTSPGANISGNVKIGDRCYIGTGSVIREKLEIGNDCTLGMGAVLTKSMPSGETWVGNPARLMTK